MHPLNYKIVNQFRVLTIKSEFDREIIVKLSFIILIVMYQNFIQKIKKVDLNKQNYSYKLNTNFINNTLKKIKFDT